MEYSPEKAVTEVTHLVVDKVMALELLPLAVMMEVQSFCFCLAFFFLCLFPLFVAKQTTYYEVIVQ